ncbi:MAG: GHMP kinase, partial [Clostridia bacterium]|nr:GHMP kinase [Clostridia bacterium]
ADHLRGVLRILHSECYTMVRGVKCLRQGDLPIGGLSSSASVIIGFMLTICKVNNIGLAPEEIIRLAQKVENEYVGVSCGTLDQSCEVYSKKNHLLYLDTLDGSYKLLAQHKDMPDYEIGIFFSGVPRSLAGTKFNMRVDECRAAAYYITAAMGKSYGKFRETYLRGVPIEDFEKHKDKLPATWRSRAEHYYSEQWRVELGAEFWQKGDLVSFGKTVNESGFSSIYNYDTGSPELKALYEAMLKTDGIYGGRFSGAGFKGCCMALVDPKYKESITKSITEQYLAQFPELKNAFSVHYCKTADGVKR